MLSLRNIFSRVYQLLWHEKILRELSMTFLLLGSSLGSTLAHFQPKPKQTATPTARVYTYVEQMPQLPGGGGMGAIVSAFYQRLQIPPNMLNEYSSRPIIYFEVSSAGNVQNSKLIASSHSLALDKALLIAVNSLPKFVPGYQTGKSVTVSFTLPISCILPQ
jgi:hypothetical protein